MCKIDIFKARSFLLVSMILSAISISANAENRTLEVIKNEIKPDAGFVEVSGDGQFQKLVIFDKFAIQARVDSQAGGRKIAIIVSDGSKSFLGCLDERKKPVHPTGDTQVIFAYRPIGNGRHLEFSVEYPIESPYSGKARRHVFKMPVKGSGSISLGDGIMVEKMGDWVAYTQIGGVIGPRGASKLEFQFPLEGAALQQGYVAIGSSAWEYTIESKTAKGVVNGTEVVALGMGNGKAISPVLLMERSPSIRQKQSLGAPGFMQPDAGVSTYEISSQTKILCPIGSCNGNPRELCRLSGIPIMNCWCPDGFTCSFRY